MDREAQKWADPADTFAAHKGQQVSEPRPASAAWPYSFRYLRLTLYKISSNGSIVIGN